jgi:hypothetical protein
MSEPKVSTSSSYVLEECVICLENDPTHIILPCHHVCVCEGCAKVVLEAKITCPFDSYPVASIGRYEPVPEVEPAPILELDVVEFKQKRRQDYVRVARNAGYLGGSAQARAVGRHICNELEQRQRETKGGDRCMGKQKTTEEKDGRLHVSYKVGRKTFREDYEAVVEVPEEYADKEDLELAIEHPEYYWTRFHNKKKLKT